MDYIERLSRKCYYVCLALIGIWALIYVVMKIFNISLQDLNMPTCVLYDLAGLYCPGCGGTRSVISLMHFDVVRSFLYHPVVPYTAVVVGLFVITHTLNIFTKGKVKAMKFRPIYLYIMLAIIVLQFIIKNAIILITGSDPLLLL